MSKGIETFTESLAAEFEATYARFDAAWSEGASDKDSHDAEDDMRELIHEHHDRIARALRLLEVWEHRAEIEMPTDSRIMAALREVAP